MVLCQCVSVSKEEANRIISYLLKKDVVRKDLKIRFDSSSVHIPVKGAFTLEGAALQRLDFQRREVPVPPADRVNAKLRDMGIREAFPDKFIMLGDALFLKESRLPDLPRKAYSMVAEEFNAKSVYTDQGIGQSPLRKPDVKLLWGEPGIITHEENGILYSFDPSKVMFSPGNVNARIEESSTSLDGCTIVDMFAGIGYFSLQLANGSPGATVYACELNPDSYSYLVENIRRNRFEGRIKAVPGDCRNTTAGLIADYILMGHFDCKHFLATALRMSHEGTVLNMHILCDTASLGTHWYQIIENARALGYGIDFQSQRAVKSYGPHLWHVSTRFSVTRIL